MKTINTRQPSQEMDEYGRQLRVGASVVLGLALAWCNLASAGLINVDFCAPTGRGFGLPPQEGAAAIGSAGDQWNGTYVNGGTGVALVDSGNNATTVTMDWSADNWWNQYPNQFDSTAYANLARGYLCSAWGGWTPITVTLHGLAAGRYDLYGYNIPFNTTDNFTWSLTAGGTGYTEVGFDPNGGGAAGTGVLAEGKNFGILYATVGGDGVLSFAVSRTAGNETLVSGFQLQSVPEPGSLMLLLLAGFGLMAPFWRKRK